MEAALLIALVFYFLPWMIATARNHTNSAAIFMLNLFLGWTFVGWVAALVWSFTNNTKPAASLGPRGLPPLKTEKPKICSYCKAQNSRAFRFCAQCGQSL